MIASVFCPCGIVTATSCLDTFFEPREKDGDVIAYPIGIEGLPHLLTFWDTYALVFKIINQSSYDSSVSVSLSSLESFWDDTPSPEEFIASFKRVITENKIQLLGIVSTYYSKDGKRKIPYVYQVLGQDTRRINIDNKGDINYNCICLEKEPILGRLLKQVKLRNGDIWEDLAECTPRYDLFSISKSVDFCKFAIKTDHFINNITTTTYQAPILIDMAVVTPNSIEISQNKY